MQGAVTLLRGHRTARVRVLKRDWGYPNRRSGMRALSQATGLSFLKDAYNHLVKVLNCLPLQLEFLK